MKWNKPKNINDCAIVVETKQLDKGVMGYRVRSR